VTDVHAWADQLRQYATHFALHDWRYTRRTNIRHIRYRDDWVGYFHPWRRVVRWLGAYVARGDDWVTRTGREIAWRHPIIHTRASLSTETHEPDGVLDEGRIITHWEETGEYLQYVQPSVGALLADLMDAHPDLPEVVAIAAEMKRINDDYSRRIQEETD